MISIRITRGKLRKKNLPQAFMEGAFPLHNTTKKHFTNSRFRGMLKV
ncbi:hypothetical protein HMPREF9554_03089 [Treponema phagedenis F0421]|nr:hypothetical protein HMPREF9554_03089 [Treponema phagedenis F0421]